MASKHHVGSVIGAVFVLGLGAACGDNVDETRMERGIGAQPAAGTDTFERGLFDELPHPPRSEPLGPRAEKADVVVQSFQVRDSLPVEIVAFYEQRLTGEWSTRQDPRQIGADPTWRGVWVRGIWELTVSAMDAPTLNQTADPEAA